MIGVSGMRGTVGGTLTPAVVGRMAAAFAATLPESGVDAPTVVLGRDSRPSGAWVRDAAAAALVASGCGVVDLGVVTTPGVAMMVHHLGANAGVVVTASHNPIEWNGLKFLGPDAAALPADRAQGVADAYHAGRTAFVPVDHLVPPRRDDSTHALHVKRVLDRADVLGVSSRAYKVVLDSVCGAGGVPGATLLSKLGCRLVHLNPDPTGQFPHPPEPTAENLGGLCDEVKRQKAAVGFAQDPDADRLAVVDENGAYIGEEYSLALLALQRMRKRPGLVAVTNLSTSRMLDDVAASHGGRVVRTPVGEANVVAAMRRENAHLGGEGNGGVIDARVVPGRDSLVGMAAVLQLMSETGKTVSQLVAELPRYEIVKTKFECGRDDAARAVAAVRASFEGTPGVTVDVQDGVRVDWPDAWVHARPSNTEPIVRIIAEAPTRAGAEGRAASVRAVVDAAL